MVTGVSSGIGYGIARLLTEHNLHVFGSVRKQADATRLSEEFGEARFTPLIFDVTDEVAVRRAAGQVRQQLQGHRLLGLVNNSGIAAFGPASLCSVIEARQLLDVNLVGTLICVQAFLPLLGSDKTLQGPAGRILQISSVVAELDMPFNGVYAASKHALEALTTSLRRELRLYGILVVIIRPGVTKSDEFWHKVDWNSCKGTEWEQHMQALHDINMDGIRKTITTPSSVATVVYTALVARQPRLMYWASYWEEWFMTRLLGSWLPKQWADFIWLKLFQSKFAAQKGLDK